MTDFRTIERELTEFLDAAGVDVIRDAGDAFVVVAAIPYCGRPRKCEAVRHRDGRIKCAVCDDEDVKSTDVQTLSLTKLAERLAGK